MNASDFGKTLGAVLDAHFSSRPGVLEAVAAGAAFEQWFALEARLAIEAARPALGLDEKVPYANHEVWRYWTANEYKKVDLYIADSLGGDGEAEEGGNSASPCLAAIEFKLIHNNKNWPSKCQQVLTDLYPTRRKPPRPNKTKAKNKKKPKHTAREKIQLKPALGWFSVPVLIGKTYWDPSIYYPGSGFDSIKEWLGAVDHRLASATKELWRTPKVRTVEGEYQEPPSHLSFRVLSPR